MTFFFGYTKPFSYLLFGLPIYYFLRLKQKLRPIDVFIGVWLLAEIAFCLLSRREYKQYFLTTIIPISLMLSFFYKEIENRFVKSSHKVFLLLIFMTSILLLNVSELISLTTSFDEHKPFNKQLIFRSYLYNNFQEHQESIDFISKNSLPSDKILIWGSEPSLLFLTNRKSVDGFYYQFRLFLPGYDTEETRLTELVDDVVKNNPKLIIDASTSTIDSDIGKYPQSPPLEITSYQTWLIKTGNSESRQIIRLIDFIAKNYNKSFALYEKSWNTYIAK